MSGKPIFVATHPRACSTAFERVFMTRPDLLTCVHEPFGDAFYFGPERLSERYEDTEKEREKSGFSDSTYKTVVDRLDKESAEALLLNYLFKSLILKQGKRLFIKDIIHYLVPPSGKPSLIAPSLTRIGKGVSITDAPTNATENGVKGALYPYHTYTESNNPTVVPEEILKQFHFTFLIRHPRFSIPSYYRCTIPPLDKFTGFYNFMPSEVGYNELRRVFDYLRSIGQIGPKVASQDNATTENVKDDGLGKVDICLVDADDLLDNPNGIIEAYCKSVGLHYDPAMLEWTEANQQQAKDAFEKWFGFHEDAIQSSSLKPRLNKKPFKSNEDEDAEWREKYGQEGARMIRETVNANLQDYEYLKQFALRV